MTLLKLLGQGKFYEMQVYQKKQQDIENEAVCYEGSPRNHYNPNVILLWSDPINKDSIIYEFRVEDILFAEEIKSITRPDGVVVEMVKLWINKGSMGMKMQPITV